MGAARRARRQVERSQIKDAARRVRAIRLAERQESEAMHAAALGMAEGFESGLVRDPKTGVPVYAVASELADNGE